MGRKYTLLRSQRRQVFEVLHEAGLEPAEFSWIEKDAVGGNFIVSRLNYRDPAYYFQFSWYEMSSWCILSPGRYRSIEYEHPMNWKEQEASLRAWAQCLRREIESPDPWTELARYRIAIGAELPDSVINETISGYEADHIAQLLDQMADLMEKEFRPSPQQSTLVRGRLAYLAEAAKRQKSRDWLYTALGVCTTIGMTLSLDGDATHLLWQQVRSHLGNIIRMPVSSGSGSSRQGGEIQGM